MLDIKYVRENLEAVKSMIAKRGKRLDIDNIVELDEVRLEYVRAVEALRSERNKVSKNFTPENIERSKSIKLELKDLEDKQREASSDLTELLMSIPNILHPDVPEGATDEDNVELKRWGTIKELDFKPLPHEILGERLDLFDVKKGAEVSGSGFYYLKGAAVLLEFALIRYAMEVLMKEGFEPMITPELVRTKYASSTGYLPKREEADIYKLENDDLYLIATAEIPLAAYHSDEVLAEEDLPRKYVGFSSCFRREAGAHGKHKKGIFRVHQFDKVEMFAFVKPEDSMEMFGQLIEISEKLFQGLEIPYRMVNICSGDMNGPGYIKYDIEYYSPVDCEYREMTSGTNTLDYQARRLNVRYKNKSTGKTEFVHTLNNTTFAIGRTLIAIMENYQQADGSIVVPEVLRAYVGKDVIR